MTPDPGKPEPANPRQSARPSPADEPGRGADASASRRAGPSSKLEIAAFIWLVILLAMLSLPPSAWINSIATLVAVGAGALWFWFGRRKR